MNYVLAVLCCVVATQATNVTFVEWQGCPDCTKFGDDFVARGLDKDLGVMMDFTVLYIAGHHPGVVADPQFLPFAACAQDVPRFGSNFTWYKVLNCANPGELIETCCKKVGLSETQYTAIHSCMANTTRSAALVTEMNSRAAATASDYPWSIVDGKAMPEPDTHGDNAGPTIQEICNDNWHVPEACKKQ